MATSPGSGDAALSERPPAPAIAARSGVPQLVSNECVAELVDGDRQNERDEPEDDRAHIDLAKVDQRGRVKTDVTMSARVVRRLHKPG